MIEASKILVTGFDAYAGRSANPSAQIVETLNGRNIGGHAVHGVVMPVVNKDLFTRVQALIQQVRPVAIVALGLCPGEGMIRLERLAANYSSFEIQDNAGERYTGPVIAGGPAAYEATLPLNRILSTLLESGIPARLSNTAGTYLCNAQMYSVLHHCALSFPECRSGFIHLPLMPSQVCETLIGAGDIVDSHHQTTLSSMPLDMQIRAVETAIGCIDL